MKVDDLVILVGGRGSRIGKITINTPKPLIKINGKPLVCYIIEKYLDIGANKIVLLTGFKHEYFLKNKFLRKYKEVKICYTGLNSSVFERLKKVKNQILNEYFYFTYGDSYAELNLMKTMTKTIKSKKLLSVTTSDYKLPFGSFVFKNDSRIVSYKEKKILDINSGYYVASKKIFKFAHICKSLERDLIPLLIYKNQCIRSTKVKNWFPVDDKNTYERFKNFLDKKNLKKT